MSSTRLSTTFLAAFLTIAGSAAPAFAEVNLVLNGGFEDVTLNGAPATQSEQLAKSGNTQAGVVATGWTNTGYGFIFTPGSADQGGAVTPEFNSTTTLWGPGAAGGGSNNGLTATSPFGGNYLVEDGGYEPGAIYQSIGGLSVGGNYLLTFDWAAAQEHNAAYVSPTTESWYFGFGNQYSQTQVVSTPGKGFTPWMQASYLFTASATSQLLGFLAAGTPAGQPPYSLLDGVSLVAAPEPSAWSILVMGLVGVGGAGWLRRRAAARSAAALS